MKKINLLLMIGTLLLPTYSTYANYYDKDFYVKLIIITANKLATTKDNINEMNSLTKQTSQISPGIGVGAGYHFNDSFRMDLTFENYTFHFNDSINELKTFSEGDGSFIGTKVTKRKGIGASLMLNGYVNILNRDTYQIFVGAGIGAVRLKEKVSYLISGNLINDEQFHSYPSIVENHSSKTSINPSYSLLFGINTKINKQINLEFMYKWQNYGKIKYAAGSPVRKNIYRGSSISVTLGVDL